MTKTLLLAASAIFLFTGAANAADYGADNWREGLYIKGGAGWSHLQDQDYNDGGSAVSTDPDNGYAITGAVGSTYKTQYGGFRPEFEVTYRDNDIGGGNINGASAANAGGNIDSTAFMFNGYYDIPTGMPIRPYVGAGLGVAHVNVDNYTVGGSTADGDDNVFAYQAMAGAEFDVAPKTALYTEYKYFGTDGIDVGTAAGNSTDMDYDNHSIMAGVKYSFN